MGAPPTSDVTSGFRRISLAELQQAAELIRAHWEEVALSKDLMVLDPDWAKYELLDASGGLLVVGAFAEERLIGYSVGLVTGHMHYRGLVYYQNDALFVDRQHRRGEVGLNLIQCSESLAEEQGAKFFCWHAKQGTALDALLSRKGYAVQDIIYSRRV
jgi:predicted GNAT superfamily acetyltransferase